MRCPSLVLVAVLALAALDAHAIQKDSRMTTHAKGTFDVKVTPQTPAGSGDDAALGRMTIEKTFHGDLAGTSTGQMLTGDGGLVKDSGVYVAIEKVTGSLAGRSGTFILHHTGVMTRGAPSLTITVAPDSGTGQLEGIAGTMAITIVDGKHSYDFEYSIAK